MANRYRGEIEASIDGASCRLCLTLGALAELESAFGSGDLVALAQRFASGRLSSRDVLVLLACGLRGGGRAVTDDEVAAMTFDGGLSGAVAIAADLIAVTFGSTQEAREPANPPVPQDR